MEITNNPKLLIYLAVYGVVMVAMGIVKISSLRARD